MNQKCSLRCVVMLAAVLGLAGGARLEAQMPTPPPVRWSAATSIRLKPGQTFAMLSVAPAERPLVARAMQHALCGASVAGECRDATKSVLAAIFSLGNGESVVVVQGTGKQFCPAGSGCAFLLLRKHGAGYVAEIHATAESFAVWLETPKKRPEVVLATGSELQEFVLCGERFAQAADYHVAAADAANPFGSITLTRRFAGACSLTK